MFSISRVQSQKLDSPVARPSQRINRAAIITSEDKKDQGIRKLFLLICMLLCVTVLLVWGQTVRFDFVDWDDPVNVLNNAHLQAEGKGAGAFWAASYWNQYTPVTYSVWAWCAQLARLSTPLVSQSVGASSFSPLLFHALNVAVHLGSVWLVFGLLRRLLRYVPADTGQSVKGDWAREGAAGAGAFLFAVHPLQAESIAWVTGFHVLLGAFFAFATLHCYLLYVESQDSHPARARIFATLATVLYVLALLSKPTIVALPIIALVLEVGVLRRSVRRFAPLLLVWSVLAIGDALMTRSSANDSMRDITLPVWGRPFIALDALAFYLGRLVWPASLAVDYGRTPQSVLSHGWGYAYGLVPIVLGLVLWRTRQRGLLVAALLTVAVLLPVLGLTPTYFHRISTVADRYMYLAFVGPAWGLSYALLRWGTRHRPVWIVASAVLCGYAIGGARQAQVWRDTHALFTHALAVNPDSLRASLKLGLERNRAGDPDRAIDLFEQAARLDPNDPETRYDLGSALARRGDMDAGVRELREAIRLKAGYADAYNNLGLALSRTGKKNEAIDAFQTALQLRPTDAAIQQNLAALQWENTRTPSPSEDPAASAANAQGVSLARANRTDEALVTFRQVIRLRPDYAEAFFNLGVALAHSDEPEAKSEAIRAYRSALHRKPDYPEARFNLGVALAQTGDLTGAETELAEAVRLRPDWAQAKQALNGVRQAQR